ncbi:metallophosphoesterase [Sphingobacterium sp. HMA12]|uniref:metallophosphoesterase n=1 Tax=Sphingobacterium sp. HMA12 TaxID=2050894 RepID=UPI000CEA6EAC|nr:metallophosphoesterase [Sphingobacterium sp. HMA12]
MGIKIFLPLLFSLFYSIGQGQSLVRIGLIADPQYADKDSRGSRFYRNSLVKLDAAVVAINKEDVDFTVMLGDLVDVGTKDLPPAIQQLDKLKKPVYNILGNHDYVDVEDGADLYKAYKMPAPYYTVAKGEWLFILLNTNELAEYATTAGSGQRQAWQLLNDRLKTAKRSNDQPWNGGVSTKQLKWLRKQLHNAQSTSKKVIVFTHHPLYPENGLEALNNRDILTLIEKYPVVKAVISGHHHPGNFATYKGIPMITLEGMIETDSQNAFGILELGANQLSLHGEGRMTSRKIDF